MKSNLANTAEAFVKLAKAERAKTGTDCSMSLEGDELVLIGNEAALLAIAARIIQLVDKGITGAHFTVDSADIAPEGNCAMTIALRSSS